MTDQEAYKDPFEPMIAPPEEPPAGDPFEPVTAPGVESPFGDPSETPMPDPFPGSGGDGDEIIEMPIPGGDQSY